MGLQTWEAGPALWRGQPQGFDTRGWLFGGPQNASEEAGERLPQRCLAAGGASDARPCMAYQWRPPYLEYFKEFVWESYGF